MIENMSLNAPTVGGDDKKKCSVMDSVLCMRRGGLSNWKYPPPPQKKPQSETAAKRQHMEAIKTERSFGWEITRSHQNECCSPK